MSIEKMDSGVCKDCPTAASYKAANEVIENNPNLYEGSAKNIVLGAIVLEEQILSSIAKKIDCQGPKINQHNQHVCSLATAFNSTINSVGGPNGRVKGSIRFESLVSEEDDEKNGQYL